MNTINQLRDRLFKLNDQYRKGNPTVSDSEYDSLVDKLRSLNPDDPFFERGVVELKPDDRKKRLPIRSMSLDKFKTIDQLSKWLKDDYHYILPKYDGITIIVDTKNDTFMTRGDGEIGRDCTQHLQHLKPYLHDLGGVLKGELVITNDTWNKYKDTVFKDYTSPRNTVAGWINGDYDKDVPYELMTLVLYQWYREKNDVLYSTRMIELREKIEDDEKVKVSVAESINNSTDVDQSGFKSLFDKFARLYPIDGLVFYKDKPVEELYKNEESNGNPTDIKAYKSPIFSEEKYTVIESVSWNMNRFGVLTPVINVIPVTISNASVSKVNGISYSYIHDMCLYPGALIAIKRSGEVIPKITKSHDVAIPFSDEFTSNKEYQREYDRCVSEIHKRIKEHHYDLTRCPYCGGALSKDSVNICCTNKECEERRFQWLFRFFEILGVEEYKEESFRSVWNHNHRTVGSFIGLTVQDVMDIDGWGKASSEDFVSRIQKAVTSIYPIETVAYASGLFSNLATKTLTIIFDYMIENNLCKVKDNKVVLLDYFTAEDLQKIERIGSSKAELFYFRLPHFLEFLSEHESWLKIEKKIKNKQEKTGKLSGLSFCFTGFRDKQSEEMIESMGGSVVNGVSKKLSYLVVKDKASTSSKMEAAKKNNVNIIDINGLKELLSC